MNTETRLECLRLAVESGASPWEAVRLADQMVAFVDGRRREVPLPIPEPAGLEARIIEMWHLLPQRERSVRQVLAGCAATGVLTNRDKVHKVLRDYLANTAESPSA